MSTTATLAPPPPTAAPAAPAQSKDARAAPAGDTLLSLAQAAVLLGESLQETRDLTSMRLLKYQLIDGERCVLLSDLIAYKADFDKRYAAYLASPTSRIDDDMPNPFDVLPEYAQMLE